MKNVFKWIWLPVLCIMAACGTPASEGGSASTSTPAPGAGQSGVVDTTSAPNIVQTAVKSPDHTTLVKAVQAAGLVDALSNAGPFTVFAPTNAAFDKLPAGTVDNLLKPENKAALSDALEYHTYVGVLRPTLLLDGLEFEMVNGKKIKVSRQGDKVFINGKEVGPSIETSNGIIYVMSDVLTAQ